MLYKTCLLGASTALLSACVAPYSEPVKGSPVAYVRFTDSMGAGLMGQRRSRVLFYDNAECRNPASVDSAEWIAVPAKREIGFHHFLDNGVAGVVQGYCGVWSKLVLTEGQRVEMTFSLSSVGGLNPKCKETAIDVTSGGGRGVALPLQRLQGPQCIHSG